MRKSFAGQSEGEAHNATAGDPGGQSSDDALGCRAARDKRKRKEFAGHNVGEAHGASAGVPGGQEDSANQVRAAARQEIAGRICIDTPCTARNGADLSHVHSEAQRSPAEVRATINQVMESGRENAFAIRQRMRVRQAALSHIARVYFGYHTGLKEDARKKAMDGAAKLIKAIQAGETHPAARLVSATDGAAAPWEEIERNTEKDLVRLARRLPAYEWVKGVRGFGELSFARIIAETGDLSGYANPAKVWKRLGLAVIDGKSQRKARDVEKAKEQGYSPYRRAVAYVAFEPVLKAQSAPKESGGQNGDEAQEKLAAGANGVGQDLSDAHHAVAGPYRQLYDRKKAEYLARGEAGEEGWTKLHAHRAAMRYASKRMFRDLWVAWRRDIAGQNVDEAQSSHAGDGDRGGHVSTEAQKITAAPVTAL